MVRLIVLLLTLLPLPALAPEAPPADLRVVGEVVNPVAAQALSLAENQTGEDLTGEEVDILVTVNVTNAEFDLVGILLGGGAVETDFRVDARFEFRAISVERLDAALQAVNPYTNASARKTFGLDAAGTVVTAEAFRTLAGGVIVTAFRDAEERAATGFVENSLPGMTVLASSFRWSNLVPVEGATELEVSEDPREPPVVLEARFDLRFLDRVSITDLLGKVRAPGEEAPPRPDARSLLKESIKRNQTVPPLERTAFMIAGLDQLLAPTVPPGWRLNLTFTVPKGFTIEGATDELSVSGDKRTATYIADGSQAFRPLADASVITLSNRSLVTVVLLALTVAVGLLGRTAVEGWAKHARRQRTLRAATERAAGPAKEAAAALVRR